MAVGAEQGMHRADGQGIGTFGGCAAGQVFQGASVAQAAVAGAAQSIELCAQPPDTRALRQLHHARTRRGSDCQAQLVLADGQLVVAGRIRRHQAAVGIQAAVQQAAVLKA
ncbi:hypothetical protein D3C76_899270 [compost metagenome]